MGQANAVDGSQLLPPRYDRKTLIYRRVLFCHASLMQHIRVGVKRGIGAGV